MSLLKKAHSWYRRFERPISSFSLIFGFIFDAFTLKRVDMFWENFWVLAHIVIIAVFIILINLRENKNDEGEAFDRIHFWYVNILQFFFGGLFSTYLVFYFRSTDIFTTWPFLLILILAFIANESFKRHYARLSFQISLFFLSVYSFAIFIIPVILHKISTRVFLLSGLISLSIILLFILILSLITKDKFNKNRKRLVIGISSIFIVVNLLYFTNLIPPIPLSLKEVGIYHSIQKNQDGNYVVASEAYDWKDYFKLYKDFNKVSGDPVYIYSAIFSPENFNMDIIHEWQYYNENQKKWITKTVVRLHVMGGRDGGFRTYSMHSDPEIGKWRVNIKTETGQTIGSLHFNVIGSGVEPVLTGEVKK